MLPFLLLLGGSSSACGIAAQSMIGWSTDETVRRTATQQVRIESTPEGAQVSRIDEAGGERIVGLTPLSDPVDYQVEETISTPRTWALLGTGLGEVALGAVLAGVGTSVRGQSDGTGGTGLFVGGGGFLVFGAVDAVWGLVRLFARPQVTARRVVEAPRPTYVVEKDGMRKTARIAVPLTGGAKIDSGTGEVVARPPPVVEDGRVIAVMDVEDANAEGDDAAARTLVRDLSDQLRIFVTVQGVKTIDRGEQERAFHAQLVAIKAESYDACYDDTCQIELGKALAASHILRSKITRFGSRCVLNGELVDLAREVTVRAASAKGTCQAEGFLEMSEDVARDLMRP